MLARVEELTDRALGLDEAVPVPVGGSTAAGRDRRGPRMPAGPPCRSWPPRPGSWTWPAGAAAAGTGRSRDAARCMPLQ